MTSGYGPVRFAWPADGIDGSQGLTPMAAAPLSIGPDLSPQESHHARSPGPSSADFDQRFARLSRRQARGLRRCRAGDPRHRRRRGRARRRRPDRGDEEVRPARDRSRRPARDRGRDRRRGEGLRRQDARRAEIRARPDRGVPPPPAAEGRALHRRARRRARLALERDRCGRPLCARRHRGLSVLGADECGAGARSPACRAW